MNLPLKEKTALITGGARGIGKTIAKQFLENGALVLICSRNKKELENTAIELDPSGKSIHCFPADISKFEECKSLFKYAVKLFGHLDILVNNAGIYGPVGLLEENPTEKWIETININLLGTVYCTQLAIPIMKKNKKGKIINLAGAGIGGSKPLSRFSAYYTSKASIAAFTEVIASELINYNIRINCISPGAVNTYFSDYLLSLDPEKVGPMYGKTLKQRKTGGDPPELGAKLAVFLASDESSKISGKIISAKWDKIDNLKKITEKDKNKYTLRRIDEELFNEKK